MAAKAKESPQGKYDKKRNCTCGATSWGNDQVDQQHGGWECPHCGRVHSVEMPRGPFGL